VVGLNPGDTLSAGMEVEFQLNLDSPLVNAFLQEQLNQGWVGLVATSIHESSFGGSPAYPSFETKENLVGQAGILELDVLVIPEPTALVLLGAGLLVSALCHGSRGASDAELCQRSGLGRRRKCDSTSGQCTVSLEARAVFELQCPGGVSPAQGPGPQFGRG
jgi:hypothetical protein